MEKIKNVGYGICLLFALSLFLSEKFENNEDPTPEELHNRVYEKICKLIQFPLNKEKMEFHEVRMVSPTKPMFCVSFELPEEVAFKQSK